MYKSKTNQKIATHKHYVANRDKVKARSKARTILIRKLNREFILGYLSTHPCVDCGNSNPIVLDFDHITGEKERNVSRMSHEGYSLVRIKQEISKCEVRCANCHRIVTHERRTK